MTKFRAKLAPRTSRPLIRPLRQQSRATSNRDAYHAERTRLVMFAGIAFALGMAAVIVLGHIAPCPAGLATFC